MPASSLVTTVDHGVALQEVNVVHSCHDEFQQVQVIQKTLIHSSLVVSAAHAGAGSSAIAGDHPSALPGGILSSAHAGGVPLALVSDHRSTLPGACRCWFFSYCR